jgi:hypothetical protein
MKTTDRDYHLLGAFIAARVVAENPGTVGSMTLKALGSIYLAGEVPPESIMEKVRVEMDGLYKRKARLIDGLAARHTAKAA